MPPEQPKETAHTVEFSPDCSQGALPRFLAGALDQLAAQGDGDAEVGALCVEGSSGGISGQRAPPTSKERQAEGVKEGGALCASDGPKSGEEEAVWTG